MLRDGRDDTLRDVRARERCWAEIEGDGSPVAPWRAACDLWCARWFLDRSRAPSSPELRAAFDALLRDDRSLSDTRGGLRLSAWVAAAREIARKQRFFHWPLEFADVFYDNDGSPRARPGFDAVIGNPPWEMLRGGDPARRDLVTFIRESGLYPSCDRGHVNLYQPFLERSLSLTRPGGRVGLVLPWGLAADEGAATLRKRLLTRDRIDTIVGLDNSAGLFPIHRGLRFMVVVASPGSAPRAIRARFGVRTSAEIDEFPGTDEPGMPSSFPARLDADTIRVAGGASLRIPDARRPGDLEWLVAQCRKFPALGDRSGWNLRFGRELNATDDREASGSRAFRSSRASTSRRSAWTRARPRAGFHPKRPPLCFRPAVSVAPVSPIATCPASETGSRSSPPIVPAGRRDHAHALLPAKCSARRTAALPLRAVQLLVAQSHRPHAHGRACHDGARGTPAGAAVDRRRTDQRALADLARQLAQAADRRTTTSRRAEGAARRDRRPSIGRRVHIPAVPNYGFAIDLRKCIGCHACTIACKSEHDIPVGVNRCWVKTVEKGTFPQTQRLFFPVLCNQCEDAPCMNICPTSALFRRRDGIVDLNGDSCIGCRACMAACPYDQLFIDPNTRTAEKCNFCANRVENKLEPACVSVCPTECRIFGDLDDPTSEVAQIVQREAFMLRKPEKGTGPKIFYLGADEAAIRPEIATRPFMFREGQVHMRPLGSPDPDRTPARRSRAWTTTCRIGRPGASTSFCICCSRASRRARCSCRRCSGSWAIARRSWVWRDRSCR